MTAKHTARAGGFTLIELMIVVAVLAIIAAIAYPSYNSHVTKTRRGAAASCTLEAAQFMERFYTTNLRYDQDRDGNPVALPQLQCIRDIEGHYTVRLADVGSGSYLVEAEPQGTQAARDGACGALSLDQTGQKDVSGAAEVSACW